MGANTQTFLNVFAAPAALLRREVRGNSYHHMTSSFSLICEDIEKCAPTGIVNALSEMMVLNHTCDVQIFNTDAAVPLRVLLRCLEMEVAALTADLKVLARDFTLRLTPAVASLASAVAEALCMGQALLAAPIVSGILHCAALGVRQKYRQADIQTNRCVLADLLLRVNASHFILRQGLTDDQCIPVAIRTQHEVCGHGRPFHGAVQFDLEQLAQFGRDMQVLAVIVQPHVAAHRVLAQLDTMPAVWRLEAGEANRQAQVFHLKIPFECLAETVSQHLHRSGWHMFSSTPFELGREVVLCRECTQRIIFGFQRLQHLIVNGSRLYETSHQLLALCTVWIDTVLKRSHILIVLHRMRDKQVVEYGWRLTAPRLSPPCLKARALSRDFW